MSTDQNTEHSIPAWADEMSPDDFICYMPSYVAGYFFHLYDKLLYQDEQKGTLTYYMFDPIKHGADPNKKYPLLMWLHGASNSFVGDLCINYSGAELFASPAYQKGFGGAYIIVPLANEKRLKDDHVTGGHAPSFVELNRIDDHGVHLIVAHGRRDELVPFDQFIEPHIKDFDQLKHCTCYFPEWVRNSDHGISSVNFGREMGQHCLINQFHANLIYDDGTSYDEHLFPEGFTGWIRDVVK